MPIMSEERETICDPPRLPLSLSAVTAGYRWRRDRVGESGGAVYRLAGEAGRPDLYLKHGAGRMLQDRSTDLAVGALQGCPFPAGGLEREA